ncbi:MAG: AAA family ATPase [Lachnospiraceae bacterium]|nr:AAA family ATPase [Lachnospiraceae bacterium]
MNVHLKNIGIISDSTIEINGLTVITGHNNSGKTTVGKVIYSLVDAVSEIENKAANDKYSYVLEQLKNANREFSCRAVMKRNIEKIENDCIRIFFMEDYAQNIGKYDVETFLKDLIKEMQIFSIGENPYKKIIEEDISKTLFGEEIDIEEFLHEKDKCLEVLRVTMDEITKDPELINYARQSINGTLSVEFAGQIQPVALKNIFSSIEMLDGKKKCFSMELFDNEIIKAEEPVYNWMPYKNTYFIDNPFIVGDSIFARRFTRYTATKDSYIDENHIYNHELKLKLIVNRPTKKNVFETGIIEEKYKEIKAKIDAILPGEFVYTSEGQYYVNEDVHLKASNLATGSKMFSIIKLLLAKGEITEKTLLVLDEPEAHLHPKWQNLFAEIMVLLVKEVGCHILLTTHSPNFMLALEANMRKYEAQDICNFYQTKHIEESAFVDYKCVNESLEDIYEDFVTYLSDMKMLRDSYL